MRDVSPNAINRRSSWLADLDEFCLGGVDPVRLDTYRRCLAVTFLIYMVIRFTHASEWLTDYGFHLTPEDMHGGVPSPWPTMPGELVPLFGIVLFGSVGCLIAGYQVRWMTWVALACSLYVLHVDWCTVGTLNRLYVVFFTVLAASPRPRRIDLGDGTTRELQSVWPIRILQATMLIQYFCAGSCKVFQGSWHWDAPDVLWAQAQGLHRTDLCAVLLNTLPKWAWALMMYGGLLFELLSPVLFTNKRLVPLGVAWGITFHLGIALLMKGLIYFSLQMIAYYILFLSPETLIALRSWLSWPVHSRVIVRFQTQ